MLEPTYLDLMMAAEEMSEQGYRMMSVDQREKGRGFNVQTLTSFDGDPVGTSEGETEGSAVVGLDVGISDGQFDKEEEVKEEVRRS